MASWFARAMFVCILLACQPAAGTEGVRKIVLIGGLKSEGIGQHDYANGVRLLKALLESSAEVRAIDGLVVDAHPGGWPRDGSAFDGAAAVVWYFDGLEKHPLLDAARRAQTEALMEKGIGLVALHQAFTVPDDDTSIGLERWLGGARYGMFDRTTELAELTPADHPISRGATTFAYHDEFYPTIRFATAGGRVTPVLAGGLHVQFRQGKFLAIDRSVPSTVAWAFERDGGGRSFGFSGVHYLVALDQPALRRLLLNAILWTAQLDVPAGGVTSGPEGAAQAAIDAARRPKVTEAVVTRQADNQTIDLDWGRIIWHASGPLGNSDTLTVGQAIIRPGQQNPRHYHPNCDEVLHVLRGRILHSMGDRTVEMEAGDTVSIPAGVRHNARNLGITDAVLAISFSSADRQVVNE